MANRRLRLLVRAAHIVEGLMLALYVYTPLQENPLFAGLIAYLVLPALFLSGLALWQQPRLMKLLTRARTSRPMVSEPS